MKASSKKLSAGLMTVFLGSLLTIMGLYKLYRQKKCINYLKALCTGKSDHSHQKKSKVGVALLRLQVPNTFRDVLKNDILIDECIKQSGKKLWIYAVSQTNTPNDEWKCFQYVSELFNELWDVATYYKNPNLDIRIIPSLPNDGYPTWENLLLLGDLNAVYGQDSSFDLPYCNAERKRHGDLGPLSYHPLNLSIKKRINPNVTFFEDPDANLSNYNTVILGGTFDHLHNGHKKLLFFGSKICSNTMIVGVTADHMLKKKSHAYLIQSLKDRVFAMREYVYSIKPEINVEAVTLHDPFGPAITKRDVDAIIVSSETINGAVRINEIRRQAGLSELRIFACRRTESYTLSSSYIRSQKSNNKIFF